jgi:hypothetical protein
MPPLSVVPESIHLVVAPTEIREPSVVIDKTPASGPVVAHIEGGAPGITLVYVIAYRPVRQAFTPEEIEELPPFPPSIRQNARNRGYIDYEETGRSDGTAPLAVVAGHRILVGLRFSGDAADVPEETSATLVIEGANWGATSVPLYMLIADLSIELLTTAIEVRQAEETFLPVRVISIAGPATQVRLALTDHPHWTIPLHVEPVGRGETAAFALRVQAKPNAPLGTWGGWLSVAAFNGLYLRSLSFDITIRHGRISVVPREWGALVGIQGRKVAAPIRITAAGYGADVVFQPAALPPGLSLPVQTRHASMGSSVDHVLDVDVHADAPLHISAPVSVNWAATGTEFTGTLSFFLTVLPHEVTFHEVITTPTGTALGGWVEITVRSDGSYVFRGHMHGSGFDPYAFRVVAIIRSTSGSGVAAAQKSGTVGGTIGGGSRDFDWIEQGSNPSIAADWDNVRRGSMSVNKSYNDTGVLGTLGDIATAAVDWLVASVVASPMIASFYILGRELGDLTGVHFGPPNLLAGIAVKEGVVLLFGPSMVFWAMVAGVATGLSLQQREMTQAEKDFADKVFHGTVPFDNVVLTNLERDNDRKFAVPHVDGRVLLALGDFYDNPKDQATPPNTTYSTPGQVFIHELVHAWQITHTAFLTEVFWDAAKNGVCDFFGGDPYTVPSPLPDWSSLNLEQQASVVDQWYSRHKAAIDASSSTMLNDGPALNDPAFPFISGNIWTGDT